MQSEVTLRYVDVRRSVMACMETGNFSKARTLVTELKEFIPAWSEQVREEVRAAYGVTL